ncbi:hypothetical protein, partial [Staphylococcus saprophyticus]|uniref:hypothetical protein n=1 Tax=Staphylococcus saprophyticus TaxID=29385 RepID=UPI001CD93A63
KSSSLSPTPSTNPPPASSPLSLSSSPISISSISLPKSFLYFKHLISTNSIIPSNSSSPPIPNSIPSPLPSKPSSILLTHYSNLPPNFSIFLTKTIPPTP